MPFWGLITFMESNIALESPKVRWDLSALFSGLDDPKIEQTWQQATESAEGFALKYRGKINSPDLTAQTLASAIREMESLYNEVAKPMGFASLQFATDSGDPKIGAFMQKQRERGTGLSVTTMFFELELQAAPSEVIDALLKDEVLAGYSHYIQAARMYSGHC